MSRKIFSAFTFRVMSASFAATLLLATPVTASAQTPPATKPKPAMDGHKMEGHDMEMMGKEHASSGWKELDAFHTLLAATWHPLEGKNDLAPIKAKAGDMAAAAKAWAASTAPKGCDSKEIKDAVQKVNGESQALADLVAKGGGDDARVKSRLKQLHEHFELVEMGCKPEHKR